MCYTEWFISRVLLISIIIEIIPLELIEPSQFTLKFGVLLCSQDVHKIQYLKFQFISRGMVSKSCEIQ